MSLADLVDEAFIRELVERGFSYKSIGERLRVLFPGKRYLFALPLYLNFWLVMLMFPPTESRRLSARSVRRFCKDKYKCNVIAMDIRRTPRRNGFDEHLAGEVEFCELYQ